MDRSGNFFENVFEILSAKAGNFLAISKQWANACSKLVEEFLLIYVLYLL
jgi:hypothetical protein